MEILPIVFLSAWKTLLCCFMELTDVIKEQEPDDQWAYKKYTDLAYKSSIGKNAAQLRRERDAPKKAKAVDYLTSDEIAAVAKRQNIKV